MNLKKMKAQFDSSKSEKKRKLLRKHRKELKELRKKRPTDKGMDKPSTEEE